MEEDTRKRRLFQAVERSYRELEPFRKLQTSLVEEYAGDGYGGNIRSSTRREIIVNLMSQAVDAYMMALAANRPKVLVTTKHAELKPFAAHFQVAVNNLIEEIGLEHTIRRWVLDAFFCVGIVKVHMASSGFVEIEKDIWADPGKPFASNVSLDNWVHDVSATKWSEVQFAGDIYRIPKEDLQDETIYDKKAVEGVRKPARTAQTGDDRVENLSRGDEADGDEFYEMVDLIDLWIPREGVIYTYACDLSHGTVKPYGEPLATMEWNGPEFGPYKLLGFGDVPENIMPASPASHLAALARQINNIYRKQIKSAKNFKENTTYTPGSETSAQNIQRADHGDLICVADTKELGSIRSGGVSQELQMFLLNMQNDFDRAAGNLTAMLGLGSQANTVGQEKLIHGAVGGRTAYMGYRVLSAVTSLIRDLGHLTWHDTVNVIPGQMPVDGLDGYAVDATWTPEDREGDFIDYNLGIDVYSMAHKSPADRANEILTLVTQIYLPGAQMLMAQGGTVDFAKLTEILAELKDLPRLKEVIKFVGVPTAPEQPGPQGKPSATTREYIRRSVSTGGTQQSRNVMQQQAWAGMQTPQAQGVMAKPPA